MKQAIIAVAVSVALLTGSFGASAQAQEDQDRTAKAGKIGCVVGGILGGVLGSKVFKDDKAAGAVAGGALGCGAGNVVGKKWSKASQLKEFQEAQAQAQAAGLTASVEERDGIDGKGKPTKELGSMVIAYDPGDMAPVSASTAAVFDKVASITSRSQNQLTFEFSGKKGCELPLAELGKRGAFHGAGVQHAVKVSCGQGDSKFVITPLPDITQR
ncbi:hypothetical protein SMRA8_1451 [Stenotrophomonas maltophilia RA8]|uniref:glycine zipper 2TM domain-containing protein n=1 Tax=Stenotrophomonas maltophilia TaxID=40324 RepID=UPI0002C5260B|nr:glycine zipper 2TM domain-containing protein [Stenotrophomonas maltophilia]KDE89435.1 hypothetical protein DF40_015445 [Stenotrophomonas maltophilia M30]MBA0455264.1 glycine zipper 2TM domain-containing protein [Stenotrophomonas maltophilia]QGL75342.1 glycine zipper 2TM domain-containing protein [Stenotrophomonas maltophilia]CCP15477.1 hypothetical protein SMRA8_1451 [Stenotrophomonas maltophilia RA8]HEL4163122.1 glycine zipper 2TM domain-containing protein [Stenotrophomonas maltophilia]